MILRRATKFNSGIRIENWSYSDATQLRLTQCVGVVEHLKRRANIPLDQHIWDNAKISKLVADNKRRKAAYFLVFGLASVSGLAGFIFLILATACIFDGKQCPDVTEQQIAIYFCTLLFITGGLLICLRKIGRKRRRINFEDYLSADLSEKQKDILVREIKELKNTEEALYELGAYEKFRKIGSISWRAESWFLLLTENEN